MEFHGFAFGHLSELATVKVGLHTHAAAMRLLRAHTHVAPIAALQAREAQALTRITLLLAVAVEGGLDDAPLNAATGHQM
jgi:hypothetical protein